MARPYDQFEQGPLIQGDNIPKQEWYEESETQQYQIGTRYALSDGRVFRYAKAGASALVAGDLLQSAVNGGTTTYQHDLTPSAAAVGAEAITFTTVTDAITANEFTDGYLAITDGGAAASQGLMYGITTHEGGAAGALEFKIDRPLTVAVTTSSRITIIKNPYMDVIQAPATTPTGMAVGVATIAATATYYTWVQTWGLCNVLIKTALTAGASVITDLGAAGSAGITAGTETEAVLGTTGWVADTTDNGFVWLMIAP
jgi:hypothetical protein